MSKKCPPLQEILMEAWLGFILQRNFDADKMLSVLRSCPNEYRVKIARIYGASQAIVVANHDLNEGCLPGMFLGIVLLNQLARELKLLSMVEHHQALAARGEDIPNDTGLEGHLAECEKCQVKLEAIEKDALEFAKHFRDDPAKCLKEFEQGG